MKVFICGHGRHGKDYFAERLAAYSGLSHTSSSLFAAERIVRPYLEQHYGNLYDTLDDCYEDRHNNRAEWREAIADYCRTSPTRFARELFTRYDIYVGIRNPEEFLPSKKLSDLSIWVDASERVDYVDPTNQITAGMCDIIVDNSGTKDDLEVVARRLGALLADPVLTA